MRDTREFLEGDHHELLESRHRAQLGVFRLGVGRLVKTRKVRLEDRDEGAIIGRVKKFLAVDPKNSQSYLKQNLGALDKEDVEDAEGKDQRHGVGVEGEEPRQGYHRELHVALDEVVPKNGLSEAGVVEEGEEAVAVASQCSSG